MAASTQPNSSHEDFFKTFFTSLSLLELRKKIQYCVIALESGVQIWCTKRFFYHCLSERGGRFLFFGWLLWFFTCDLDINVRRVYMIKFNYNLIGLNSNSKWTSCLWQQVYSPYQNFCFFRFQDIHIMN